MWSVSSQESMLPPNKVADVSSFSSRVPVLGGKHVVDMAAIEVTAIITTKEVDVSFRVGETLRLWSDLHLSMIPMKLRHFLHIRRLGVHLLDSKRSGGSHFPRWKSQMLTSKACPRGEHVVNYHYGFYVLAFPPWKALLGPWSDLFRHEEDSFQHNKDVGQCLRKSYSRVTESMA
ncbi:hypothetical protein V6N11_039316 [Hibiscus sabdariffa]|uniref:PRONE domain-containing protein n=1 Tax=Hibiscus sabdariffa TaxID=183260 RepID=A0ABR2SML0_9ROSI